MAFTKEIIKNGQDITTVWMNKVETGIKDVESQIITTQTSLSALEAQVATLTEDAGTEGFLIDQNLHTQASPSFSGLSIAGSATLQGLTVTGGAINAITNMNQLKASSVAINSKVTNTNSLGHVYDSIVESGYMSKEGDGWYIVNNGHGKYCMQEMSFNVDSRIIITGSCAFLIENQNYSTFLDMAIFLKTSISSVPTKTSNFGGSHCKGGGYRQIPFSIIMDVPSGSYNWYLGVRPQTSESMGSGIKAGHWSFVTQAFPR